MYFDSFDVWSWTMNNKGLNHDNVSLYLSYMSVIKYTQNITVTDLQPYVVDWIKNINETQLKWHHFFLTILFIKMYFQLATCETMTYMLTNWADEWHVCSSDTMWYSQLVSMYVIVSQVPSLKYIFIKRMVRKKRCHFNCV